MSRKSVVKKNRKEALRKRFAERSKSGFLSYLKDEDGLATVGVKKFIAEVGSNYINVLERPDAEAFFEEIWVHYSVGPNNDAYLCPAKMYDEYCPVCAFREELIADGEDKEVFKEYYPGKRYVMFVVKADNKRSIKEGIFVYDFPNKVMDNIEALSLDDRTGDITCIDDPAERITLKFKRVGKTRNNTDYMGFQLMEWADDVPEEYYDGIPTVEDCLVVPDIARMKKAVNMDDDAPQPAEEDDLDGEEEEKPKRKTTKRKVKQVEPEPEDDEEDETVDPLEEELDFDEDDEGVEDEEPTPRRSKRTTPKRARRTATAPEDEDEEDDEDSEKETARSRVTGAAARRAKRRG